MDITALVTRGVLDFQRLAVMDISPPPIHGIAPSNLPRGRFDMPARRLLVTQRTVNVYLC